MIDEKDNYINHLYGTYHGLIITGNAPVSVNPRGDLQATQGIQIQGQF